MIEARIYANKHPEYEGYHTTVMLVGIETREKALELAKMFGDFLDKQAIGKSYDVHIQELARKDN